MASPWGGSPVGAMDGSGQLAKASIHLSILPHSLRFVRFDAAHVSKLLPTLLQLAFYSKERNRFYSYTVSPHEVSMIIHSDLVPLFAPYDFVSIDDKYDWRAVQVCEGFLGFDQTSVVQKLTVPLAEAGITVTYHSTYLTDFVFIEKRNVRKAIAALQHQFVVDVEGPSELIHGTTTAAPTATTADATADAARSNTSTNASASKASSAFSFHHHKLCVLPIQLRVAKLVKDRIPVGMHGLVATLFLEDTHPSTTSTPRIASFTETEDEVSLILPNDDDLLKRLEITSGMLLGSDVWVPIQVGVDKPLGFSETGIVASQSDVLANAGVTVFYWSTFTTDFTLVRVEESDTAIAALRPVFDVTVVEDAASVPVIAFNAELHFGTSSAAISKGSKAASDSDASVGASQATGATATATAAAADAAAVASTSGQAVVATAAAAQEQIEGNGSGAGGGAGAGASPQAAAAAAES